jgi:predicted nucleic acid-binding protein
LGIGGAVRGPGATGLVAPQWGNLSENLMILDSLGRSVGPGWHCQERIKRVYSTRETGQLIKNRIYLDNCCLNRPYDDLANLNVQLEAEAKIFIQNEIIKKNFELAWSFMMDYEISFNPSYDRKITFLNWKKVAVVDIDPIETILVKGKELEQRKIKKKDSLHIASAIEAKCEYFLTTDRKLSRNDIPEIKVINPLDFIRQFYLEE